MENLGPYRLISRLGAGGMGEVWRAEDTRLLRPVAIKILNDKISGDPEWTARFLREARTIAQMNHPNIATIYAIEQDGERLFIAMELIDGDPLTVMFARGPVEPREAVRIFRQVAEALGEAHEKGVVHRDVKPDNIIMAKRLVKVLDFGIAKQMAGNSKESALTQGGMIIGTPFYMSPEQALGKPVDARSDIFSLGVVIYEALAGTRPFSGETMTETMMHIIMSEPIGLGAIAPSVPRGLVAVVARCLQKQPDRRFGSAGELIAALDAINYRDLETSEPVRPPSIGKHDITQPMSAASPAMVPSPAAASPSVPVASPPKQPVAGQRALVADDDPVARYLIGTVLSQNGVAFDEASNGADAVKCLKANQYSLIFLDLLMPRIDGWGVLDFVRRLKPDRMPRLFLITGQQNQSLSAADKDVVAGVIYKPLNPEEVGRIVKQLAA